MDVSKGAVLERRKGVRRKKYVAFDLKGSDLYRTIKQAPRYSVGCVFGVVVTARIAETFRVKKSFKNNSLYCTRH